ncbi:phosphatase methylesterase [Pyrrhoderma noxium]|uniref:Protein phosphatase methylesterase 1 n=1 Tax=Pyrrhoderma noxium TaxID=2282107 RepID=A0A286U941_9AGAM|nr:phosphatase methylesterase [Pyrrhoderma noxium]
MSNLYRSAVTANINKFAQVPTIAPFADENLEEFDEEEEENDSLGSLPSSFQPKAPRSLQKRTPNPDYAPISAEGYFAQAVEVSVQASGLNFRVYYTPPVIPDNDSGKGTVMVCHHGAGYSGLSFACFAKEVRDRTGGECGVLAMDARRHGKTKPIDDKISDKDLSINVLANDAYNLLSVLFPNPAEAPIFLLVGHSMGGSVLTRVCPTLLAHKYQVTGVSVLDVVEGSAIDALPHMHQLLNSRPDGFDSIEEAVEWHVSNHTIRNPHSARISIPSLFLPAPQGTPGPSFRWRTPLRSTSSYWESWFKGLSSSFLSVRAARLLVLAGTDRLDKELMIGQMQGKFQLVVVPDTGHMIHEDNPERLAEILVEFWKRNERVIVGVKKVGEL